MRKRLLTTFVLVGVVLTLPVTAFGQVPTQDSVTANVDLTAAGFWQDIHIDARSGPSGENPTGTMSYNFITGLQFSGPVVCLAVNGNSATIRIEGANPVHVVDNGEGTATPDTFDASLEFGQPNDCSTFTPGPFPTEIANLDGVSDISVVDAQPLPTSKDQCKNGGWRNYPGFKNQGECTAFVQRGP